MGPHEELSEAARRIGRLVEASAVPARREVAALTTEGPAAKARRSAARRSADAAAARARAVGWIPFIGGGARNKSDAAARERTEAERAWMAVASRAKSAKDLLDDASRAYASARAASGRASAGGPMPPALPDRISSLLARARFLGDTDGREASKALRMGPKAFALAAEAEAIAASWDAEPAPSATAPQGFNVPALALPKKRTQFALDFDGTGTTEAEPRVWLPVPASRTREMVALGARLDRDAPRRGSQLWVPVTERSGFDAFLPLAFRRQHTRFAFPPIRHNAVGQNLWSVFDAGSWNHIRATAYDRAGHRCQVCGKQGGGLWSKITPKEERAKSGPVDCHEVWDWNAPERGAEAGIQSLNRILVLCKDCHAAFHSGHTMWRAREAGIPSEAEDYIRARRMLLNRCDGATLDVQLAADKAAWEATKGVGSWVLDLSHLAGQDYMADHTLVLKDGNKAGAGPDRIAGIPFRTEDGTLYPAAGAAELARGASAAPLRDGPGPRR